MPALPPKKSVPPRPKPPSGNCHILKAFGLQLLATSLLPKRRNNIQMYNIVYNTILYLTICSFADFELQFIVIALFSKVV